MRRKSPNFSRSQWLNTINKGKSGRFTREAPECEGEKPETEVNKHGYIEHLGGILEKSKIIVQKFNSNFIELIKKSNNPKTLIECVETIQNIPACGKAINEIQAQGKKYRQIHQNEMMENKLFPMLSGTNEFDTEALKVVQQLNLPSPFQFRSATNADSILR